MAQAALRHILLGVAASGLLMGCVTDTGGSPGGGEATVSAPRGTGAEVEAPEVFQTTDSALWDGRPSLGGIWVASPDAIDPERVVMFNPATGKSVTGALFRRERDNPGPTLQVSSDAAEALGMLAGQPTELRVTALRREEPAAPPEVEALPPVEAAPELAAEAPAEASPEATPEATPEQSEAEALAAAALDATGTAAAAAEAVVDPATATEEPPKRKTWKERRAEAKAKREAEKAAAEAAEAAAEAAAAGAVVTDPVDPAASIVTEVETAPLDATAPEVSAPAVAAAPVDAPASGAARTIQIASFSKEENANRAIEALSKIGITAEARKSDRNGTPFWGVVAVGDAALLARIRDAGFADAYFLQ